MHLQTSCTGGNQQHFSSGIAIAKKLTIFLAYLFSPLTIASPKRLDILFYSGFKYDQTG